MGIGLVFFSSSLFPETNPFMNLLYICFCFINSISFFFWSSILCSWIIESRLKILLLIFVLYNFEKVWKTWYIHYSFNYSWLRIFFIFVYYCFLAQVYIYHLLWQNLHFHDYFQLKFFYLYLFLLIFFGFFLFNIFIV